MAEYSNHDRKIMLGNLLTNWDILAESLESNIKRIEKQWIRKTDLPELDERTITPRILAIKQVEILENLLNLPKKLLDSTGDIEKEVRSITDIGTGIRASDI